MIFYDEEVGICKEGEHEYFVSYPTEIAATEQHLKSLNNLIRNAQTYLSDLVSTRNDVRKYRKSLLERNEDLNLDRLIDSNPFLQDII